MIMIGERAYYKTKNFTFMNLQNMELNQPSNYFFHFQSLSIISSCRILNRFVQMVFVNIKCPTPKAMITNFIKILEHEIAERD
jgi:hypothetical protein